MTVAAATGAGLHAAQPLIYGLFKPECYNKVRAGMGHSSGNQSVSGRSQHHPPVRLI